MYTVDSIVIIGIGCFAIGFFCGALVRALLEDMR